jgi:hypothetical protein
MATVTKPIALDETFHTTDGNNTNIADVLARLINVISPNVASYEITLPTTGYTSGTFTIWGESFTGYSITITTDHNGNPLTNFTSGMNADYPVNISGSNTDFSKLYAFEIGNGSVTVYMTSAPSSAFNVIIKEAI